MALHRSKSKLQLIRQTEIAECGLACLAMIANYYGHDLDMSAVRRSYPTSERGISLSNLIEFGTHLEISPRPVKLDMAQIKKLKLPAIAHWNFNHFVVISEVKNNLVVIYDPAKGILRLTHSQFSECFTGVAIEFTRLDSFTAKTDRSTVSFYSVVKSARNIHKHLIVIGGMALALELLALILPWYVQWVFDKVIDTSDYDLLFPLAVLFMTVLSMQFVLSYARSSLVSKIALRISISWVNNLYTHLISLPYEWYQKHTRADLLSRFSSVRAVQATLTTNAVNSLLEGMTIVTVSILLIYLYGGTLSLVVLVACATYIITKLLMIPALREASEESVISQAWQQHELVESLSGLTPIKINNKQPLRRAKFKNTAVKYANCDFTSQRLTALSSSLSLWISGLFRILILWLGAVKVSESVITSGMLLALLAYFELIMSRSIQMVDRWVEIKMLRFHLERIQEILSIESKDENYIAPYFECSSYELKLINVSYRYSVKDPYIIRDFNLTIPSGQSIAIIGPSGCGKSTVVRIMLGLIEPTEGKLLIDDKEVSSLGIWSYRELLGAVLQDDKLFAGSIFENISYFDPAADFSSIKKAANVAEIHSDIQKMPMGYHTRVGDMGASLSGGQIQRILLARAIYKNPKILILDEATSHLDEATERRVNANISELNITRIIIAHRGETIRSAERVVDLSDTLRV